MSRRVGKDAYAKPHERCKTAVGLAIFCILVLHRHVDEVTVFGGICEHQVLWPRSHAADLLFLAKDGGAGAGASCFLLFPDCHVFRHAVFLWLIL